jgi:penicillin-binding protein 2
MSVFNDRKYVIMAIFITICAVFVLRLFYVQVFNDEYKLSANNNVLRYVTDYPARGLVYDRKGKLLVYNEAAYDLMVTPKQVKDLDTMNLCNTIGITKEDFIRKLKTARQYSPYKASVFAAQLSNQTYAALQEKLYAFKGFYVQARTLRKYPSKIAGHTLGYVGEVSDATLQKDAYYRPGDYIGISGIEKAYEKDLRGKKGLKILMVDVFNRIKGHFKDGMYDTASVSGQNIVSTLDKDLQEYGEKLFANKTGGLVAIDPQTGEILACISAPSYDPNLLVGRERTKNYARLLNDPLQPLFNRALMAYYPPGSTFKLINDLIALKEGVLTPEKTYPCPGGYRMSSHTVKCDARHGSISLRAAIQHSCNTYHCYVFRSIVDQAKYGNTQEGYENWRKHVLSFGVGKRIYSDLPQELRGMVPSVKYYDKVFGKGHWRSSTVVSLGIGQGELGITPLQMANIMAIIANRGYYHTPHIIKKVGHSDEHSKAFLKKNYTLVPPAYFELILDGMQDVVERGTAAGSRVKDITILGKTGTAQNPHGKDHSLFVAFAPRDNPKIAIGLMVENGGWGASWAAPIGTLMIEKYLHDTVARKDLEKRMMEGVVHPPHYLEALKRMEQKEARKDSSEKSKNSLPEKEQDKKSSKEKLKAAPMPIGKKEVSNKSIAPGKTNTDSSQTKEIRPKKEKTSLKVLAKSDSLKTKKSLEKNPAKKDASERNKNKSDREKEGKKKRADNNSNSLTKTPVDSLKRKRDRVENETEKKKGKEEKIGERKKKKTEQDIATENGEGSKMIAADTSEKKGRTTEQKDTKRVKKKKSEKLLSDSTAKRESRKTEKQKSDSTRIKQKKKTSKNTSVNKKPAAPDSTGVVR